MPRTFTHVAVDGVLAEDEAGGDLLVAHAPRDEPQDLESPPGQAGRRGRRATPQFLLQRRRPAQRRLGSQRMLASISTSPDRMSPDMQSMKPRVNRLVTVRIWSSVAFASISARSR